VLGAIVRNGQQDGGASSLMTASAGATGATACPGAASFEDEVRPQLGALSRAAFHMTRDAAAAEDLVQDTLERAYRHFDRYKPGTNVRAWLIRIMRNVWISGHRRQVGAPRTVSLDGIEAFSPDRPTGHGPSSSEVEACVIDRLGEASILAAIETLPARFREVVALADVEGAAYQTIAAALEVPVGTVATRLFRGRQRLRSELWEQARGAGYLPKAG
jgi:RNA polymerase sigma-70 factor, ECF subfamily